MRWEKVVCNYKVEKKCEIEGKNQRKKLFEIFKIGSSAIAEWIMATAVQSTFCVCAASPTSRGKRDEARKKTNLSVRATNFHLFQCARRRHGCASPRAHLSLSIWFSDWKRNGIGGILCEFNLKNYTSCIVCISVNFLITAFSNLIKWQKWNETREKPIIISWPIP